MDLSHLTDSILLSDMKELVRQELKLNTAILWHLREIDVRKLYSDLKLPSLWAYVTRELGYSEGAAHRRITAARALKQMPSLEMKIKEGKLNLNTIALVMSEFKHEPIAKREEILTQLENKTGQEIKHFVSVVKNQPQSFFIKVDGETNGLITSFHNLVPQEPEPLKLALKESITRREKAKFGRTPLARQVYRRDLRHCVNCGSEFALEIDHILPRSHGGLDQPENLRVLCRTCNQRAALRQGLRVDRNHSSV